MYWREHWELIFLQREGDKVLQVLPVEKKKLRTKRRTEQASVTADMTWCSLSIKWKEGDVVGLGCRAACRWACCSSLSSFPYLRVSSWVCWRISAEPGLSLAAAALSGSQMSFALCFTFLHDERCWMLNNVRSKREDVWSSQATAVEETGNAYSTAHVADRVRRQMFAQRRSYQKCKSIISQDWIIQLFFFKHISKIYTLSGGM